MNSENKAAPEPDMYKADVKSARALPQNEWTAATKQEAKEEPDSLVQDDEVCSGNGGKEQDKWREMDDGRCRMMKFALWAAAQGGDVGKVKELLAKSTVNIDAKLTHHGEITALMFAACNGHELIVDELLNNGANPNAKSKTETTALMYAVANGFKSIVTALLGKGAKPNAQDDIGDTALMFAALYAPKSIIVALIDHGADPQIKNKEGKKAFDFAAVGTEEAEILKC